MSAILLSKDDDEAFIKKMKLNESDAQFIRGMRKRLEDHAKANPPKPESTTPIADALSAALSEPKP